MLYSCITIISWNIIKHNLRTSMNERIHYFIEYIFLTLYSRRVDVSVVCERWVERHILREMTSSSHIISQEPGCAYACTPMQAVSSDCLTPLIGCVSPTRHRFSALCLNLTAWFSSRGLLLVTNPFDLSADETACQSPRGH